MVPGSTGGIAGKSLSSSVENENTWHAVGDLYAVLTCTESRALSSNMDSNVRTRRIAILYALHGPGGSIL
jgi:hypothetical protein